MPTSIWQQARIVLLAITLGGTLTVLGKALIAAPTAGSAATQPSIQFPESVPVQGWQFVASEPLKLEKSKEDSVPPPAQKYRYRQGAESMDVELSYVIGDGNVSRFLFVYTPIRAANDQLKTKHHPDTGHYGVMAYEGRAYLSSCINPRGPSTVTEHQFTQNRYTYDLQGDRILPWLLNQESLIDRRCLWTLMSIPVKGSTTDPASVENAYQDLEAAWTSWYQWWQPNFPSLKKTQN